jgi:phosphoglycolate phosphatase-like HAD superfamily hydrolase
MELLLPHPAVADGVVSFLDATSVSALRIVHWRIAASSFYDRVLMRRLRRLQRRQHPFQMSPTTLVLFDIDGTILTSGGAGEYALRRGFQEEFGLEENLTQVEISGRTDSGIARQVLAKHGLEATADNIARFFKSYLRELEKELPVRQGRLLPGVQALIGHLQTRQDVCMGLLTGNLEAGAKLKLEHYGLGGIFQFGAFADDHHDRNRLGPFAMDRARCLHGHSLSVERTFVIGDTPHDIACARACGAQAVAVATGSFGVDELAAHQPDSLFEDLNRLDAVLHALGQHP